MPNVLTTDSLATGRDAIRSQLQARDLTAKPLRRFAQDRAGKGSGRARHQHTSLAHRVRADGRAGDRNQARIRLHEPDTINPDAQFVGDDLPETH